jgi:hypothetical protein
MKIALLSTAMTGVLAVSALATPTFAQDYRDGYGHDGYPTPCQQTKRSNSVAGGLFGGILGAVIGSNLAHGGGRTGGAVIGGLAGAAIGSNVARSSADNSQVCEGGPDAYAPAPADYRRDDRYRAAPPPAYRQDDGYRQDDSYRPDDGYREAPPPQAYRNDGRYDRGDQEPGADGYDD